MRMADATNRDTSSKRTAGERLQEALVELNRHQDSAGAAAALTAKALCELAGVSRNALYRYHPAVLHELHKLQRQRHREPSPARQDLERLRNDNEDLRRQVAKLAALVDHYFTAWQEASTQLTRRERELAELRREIPAKVVAVRGQTARGNT
jgi:predicted site-specific integrase-resolvase